jgi:hypothetical protein
MRICWESRLIERTGTSWINAYVNLPFIGLLFGRLHRSNEQTTWTEAEERRRVWWGIYTLDRVIALGSRGRFSAPEPVETASLPVDDTAWVNIENLVPAARNLTPSGT